MISSTADCSALHLPTYHAAKADLSVKIRMQGHFVSCISDKRAYSILTVKMQLEAYIYSPLLHRSPT